MKKTFKLKSLLLSMAVAGATTASIAPTAVQAGVSANIGAVSNYVFRGVEQTETASGYAGLDYENESGIYVGTWVADVERGVEYDLYAGWGGEFEGVAVGIGGTYYGYTHEAFDTSYTELNLSVGYGMFSAGYDIGSWEDGASTGGDADYNHIYVGAEMGDFSATLGQTDYKDEVDGALTYVDVTYSTELSAGLDGSVTYTYANSEESGVPNETFLVLGLSKSFDLM